MSSLRALRLAAQMTQEQLAAKAGVSQTLISQIEIGRTSGPTLDTLRGLAAALNTDINTIAEAVRVSHAEGNAA